MFASTFRSVAIVGVLVAVTGCTAEVRDRPASTPTSTTLASSTTSAAPAADDAVVHLVADSEPGPRLRIDGTVVEAASGAAISGATIVVYQTDQTGAYQQSDRADESTARIRGELTTDEDGRFGFVTVQPGEYPNEPVGNRHIHFHTVEAPGFQPRGFVLLFDDNVRDEVRSWAHTTGFGQVIELEGDPQSGFTGNVEIELVRTG